MEGVMNWQLFGTTFATVFLAELGDKTQLATMSLAAHEGSRLAVFLGSALALVCTSALGVLAGGLIGRWFSPQWIQRAAGTLFLILGTAMIWKSLPGH
jgi:putative Ca2+/H+ antiporter (TMEM165/GDT1 family)